MHLLQSLANVMSLNLSLPKTLYGAKVFEINDIQEQETETSRVRPLQCYIALKLATVSIRQRQATNCCLHCNSQKRDRSACDFLRWTACNRTQRTTIRLTRRTPVDRATA